MRPRVGIALVILALLAAWTWRSQLFIVSRPGETPRPLALRLAADRAPGRFDAVLPVVPVGLDRVRAADGPLVIQYWAPWERHGAAQAALIDSLQRQPEFERLRVVIVCFDPFPSVARYVVRHRLRVKVLLDTRHELSSDLPCPSVPYTYAIDGAGRIAAAQAGEVDWFAPESRAALLELLRGADVPAPAARTSI